MLKETIRHFLRRHWYEKPSAAFRQQLTQDSGEAFGIQANTFVRDGVLILPSYFAGPLLEEIRGEFERAAARVPASPKGEISIKRDTLRSASALSRAAVDAYLVKLAAYYWGKPVFLAEWSGRRILPHPAEDYAAYQYHHDSKNKQVKAMVLLTDVVPSGQRMDYIPGSQNSRWKFRTYEETRFKDAQALSAGRPIHCVGPAGTVVLFDTNGLHRGNRNDSEVRDTITANYTAGHARFITDEIPKDVLADLTDVPLRTGSANALLQRL